MRIDIVEHHTDHRGFGIKIGNVLHAPGKFNLGAPVGDVHLAKTALGFAKHHQIADAFAFVFGVITRRRSRHGGNRYADFSDQLLGAFVKAHDRTQRIIGFFINIQYVFYRRDKLGAYLRDAPFLFLPGF